MSGILSGNLSLGQMTPAAQFGLATALRRAGTNGNGTRRKRRTKAAAKKTTTRRRKSYNGKLAKGSAAMRRHMAKLRAMRRK